MIKPLELPPGLAIEGLPESELEEQGLSGVSDGGLPDPGSTVQSEVSTDVGSEPSEVDESDASAGSSSALDALVILDWDDTILPTTWLQREGLLEDNSEAPSAEQQSKLEELADCAVRTLALARQQGRVIIVTNALQGWVEWSCWKFMPGLLAEVHGVEVISARSLYEPLGAEVNQWKCFAFTQEVDALCSRGPAGRQRTILSIGDSIYEHNALLHVTRDRPDCSGKSLKFTSHPRVEELTEQHRLLLGCLQDVVEHLGDLDIDVTLA
mmetsp:Transcript_33108/g.101793  ORF Transcript_33108/g.101793 Transcript_33108/m.101793 type:complete len:268 (+) Transcript_33108:86-889(+)